MHAAFARSRSLTQTRKASLAAAADLTPRQVEVWYQNRRRDKRRCALTLLARSPACLPASLPSLLRQRCSGPHAPSRAATHRARSKATDALQRCAALEAELARLREENRSIRGAALVCAAAMEAMQRQSAHMLARAQQESAAARAALSLQGELASWGALASAAAGHGVALSNTLGFGGGAEYLQGVR